MADKLTGGWVAVRPAAGEPECPPLTVLHIGRLHQPQRRCVDPPPHPLAPTRTVPALPPVATGSRNSTTATSIAAGLAAYRSATRTAATARRATITSSHIGKSTHRPCRTCPDDTTACAEVNKRCWSMTTAIPTDGSAD